LTNFTLRRAILLDLDASLSRALAVERTKDAASDHAVPFAGMDDEDLICYRVSHNPSRT
jgi:hypothetical protein